MRKFIALGLLLAMTSPVHAENILGVRVESADANLCPATAYDKSEQGVWLEGNKPLLAFRVSWDANGTACYAWLNKVPAWDIVGAGSNTGKVRRAGQNLRFENDFIMVTFNSDTKGAQFQRRGADRTTPGRLE